MQTYFYPKPETYSVKEWFDLIQFFWPEATVLAAVEFVYDQPWNPMYRKVIGTNWGVEVEFNDN